ncbi:hypothetical protein ACU4GD_38625 [Cupriavidus basilensis]
MLLAQGAPSALAARRVDMLHVLAGASAASIRPPTWRSARRRVRRGLCGRWPPWLRNTAGSMCWSITPAYRPTATARASLRLQLLRAGHARELLRRHVVHARGAAVPAQARRLMVAVSSLAGKIGVPGRTASLGQQVRAGGLWRGAAGRTARYRRGCAWCSLAWWRPIRASTASARTGRAGRKPAARG